MRNSLTYLLILTLLPITLTFNGCGEEEYEAVHNKEKGCIEIVKEHPTQGMIRVDGVGSIGSLNTTSAPTYPDGVDTVGWVESFEWLHNKCDTYREQSIAFRTIYYLINPF